MLTLRVKDYDEEFQAETRLNMFAQFPDYDFKESLEEAGTRTDCKEKGNEIVEY
ncbi:MAG: hypothetical protein LBV67_08755 [Streptococcaceae bacterium]|jgi:hypothetical protein|nr:hypothetical protein [Streptococcaceae bacterium]